MNDNSLGKNKEYIQKYPFIQHRYYNSDKVIPLEELNSTKISEIPEGWIDITLKLCEKIMHRLEETNSVDDYYVYDVKEKYGSGRWYDNSSDDVISKYVSTWETETENTCAHCGGHAKWMSTGWIIPYCDSCKDKALLENENLRFSEINNGNS